MAVTESLSSSSITIESESFLNIGKLLRSLHMWCDALESMSQLRATAVVAVAIAPVVRHKGSQSPVVARAAVTVAFYIFHHFYICVKEIPSTLT